MSKDNVSRTPVLVLSGVSLGASLIIVAGHLLGLQHPAPMSLLSMATVPFGAALGSYVVGRVFQRRDDRPRGYPPEEVPEEVPEGSKFCQDCGQLFELRQRQEGFDPKTGVANLSYQLGCPDGDPTKPTDAYESYMSAVRASVAGGWPYTRQRYRWPNCGTATIRPLTPVGHLGHEPGETTTSCPKCIEYMLAQNIITLHDAKKLISAIGQVE